jgi:hypothetical protein
VSVLLDPSHLMNRPATLLSRTQDGPDDEYGNPTWTEVAAATTCELQQEVGWEAEGGVIQLSTWRVFLPAGTPADGWDAVNVDGDLYELEGDAWPARNPRTKNFTHVEARVRRLR